jgi:hypothetical protein
MTTPPVDPRPADPRIQRVRLLYFGSDLSVGAISRQSGVPKATISTWVKRYDWPRRPPSKTLPQVTPFGGPPGASVADQASVEVLEAAVQKSAPIKRRAAAKTRKKSPRPKFSTLVDRLYRIIIHNLELMENRMSDDVENAGDNPERDMRAIGNIVRSVEKLKEIEPEQSKRDAASAGNLKYPLSPDEEDRLRIEIVERLLKLRERRGNPDGSR